MTGFADVINTEIINSQWDALWGNIAITDIIPKPVLVITNEMDNEEEKTVLQKLLQACEIDSNKFNIMQLAVGKYTAWHSLRDNYMPKAVLLIGILPEQLGIASLFRINEANSFDNIILIPTHSIADMQLQPAIKTQLWNNALKPVFKEKKYFEI